MRVACAPTSLARRLAWRAGGLARRWPVGGWPARRVVGAAGGPLRAACSEAACSPFRAT
ncbi:MAG TPA: hypothetical protein VKV40_03155 [Ktedonobacteraceae bacterium]|nr:hypothetical protein [Ktedonobacteraceae bacterium]